jgi:hypothetical protein
MAWRREDYGYAAATLAAVVFLAYLIAGNFGLVPSPLGGGGSGGLPDAQVAALAANEIARSSLPSPLVAPTSFLPSKASVTKKTVPLGPPSVHIDTKSGTSVSLASKATVVGRVLAPAGVREVVVRFAASNGTVSTSVASTRCATSTNCAWSVAVPATLGTFNVTAIAADRAGRTAPSNQITINVVNPGNVVGGVVQGVGNAVGGVGKVVQSVPGALTGVLDNLIGLLHL